MDQRFDQNSRSKYEKQEIVDEKQEIIDGKYSTEKPKIKTNRIVPEDAFQQKEVKDTLNEWDLVSFVWFDFHKECRKGRLSQLNNLLNAIEFDLNAMMFFSINANGKVLSTQCAVPR